jgi:leader peptidase (prepilin peptidase)/N-methyltransferase
VLGEALQASPIFFVVFCSVLGLLVGSFLNVVIHRLPKILCCQRGSECHHISQHHRRQKETEESAPNELTFNLAYPASHCPECGHTIKPWQNIPVLSFLLLKGRCGNCSVKIPIQYPLVEAGTGIASALVVWTFGVSALAVAGLVLTWCLICLAVIDVVDDLVPDQITLPLLWCGLLFNSFSMFASLNDAVWGAIAGYLGLWSVYWAFKTLADRDTQGLATSNYFRL